MYKEIWWVIYVLAILSLGISLGAGFLPEQKILGRGEIFWFTTALALFSWNIALVSGGSVGYLDLKQ